MIAVDRNLVTEPNTLHKPNRSGLTELQRVRAHKGNPATASESFEFSAYKTATVKNALDELFHGKCAYCESFYSKTQPVDVEHYRPKGKVEGVDNHPGYWWLGMDWENLLPSCIDCNRRRKQDTPNPQAGTMISLLDTGRFSRSKKISTGKQAIFPLLGAFRAAAENDILDSEERLLLDPCRDDPDQHLVFHVDRQNLIGLVFPKPINPAIAPVLPRATDALDEIATEATTDGVSAMGAVSIQVYGLNRLALVQDRTRHLRDLEFLLELLVGLESTTQEVAARLNAKSIELDATDPNPPQILQDEVDFLKRIAGQMDGYLDDIRSRMRSMTEPTAPFAAQAQAWLKAYLNSP